jgi:hypothetical protein
VTAKCNVLVSGAGTEVEGDGGNERKWNVLLQWWLEAMTEKVMEVI